MSTPTSMAAALARVDELAAERDAAVTKWQNCKAELDNTLPVAHALSKANTILIDVSKNYKAQADQFEERAEDAEAEIERLIEADAENQCRIQELEVYRAADLRTIAQLEAELVSVRSQGDTAAAQTHSGGS